LGSAGTPLQPKWLAVSYGIIINLKVREPALELSGTFAERWFSRLRFHMKSVLQLIDSFDQGGSEHQAVQLTRLLKQSGRYEVHVACLSKRGTLRSQVEDLGFIDIPEFPLTSFYDSNAVKQLRQFAAMLKDLRIDVVHTHDFYTNIFGIAGGALARVPVRIASRRESSKRASQKRFVERGAYRLANVVIANCDVVRRQLIAEGLRPDKVVTIHNGLEQTYFESSNSNRDTALTRFGLPKDKPLRFVTSVANLRTVKDYPTFLRAAAEVSRKIPNSAFLIAGEGDLLESLHALAQQLGLKDRVFFLGRCNSLPELLGLSEVCVLSSASEGFSNSILEYMAAARPVVVTDVGGAREAVTHGETGYVVPTGGHEQMAACIISLLDDPEGARTMGVRAQLRAKRDFSSEIRLQKTEALYERLLKAAGN
jgi:L-malate glycosyltransferase